MKKQESQLQTACVKWFNLQYRELQGLLFSVPNGGNRNIIEAKRLKSEGVVAGVSDLILLINNGTYNSLCIEMKNGRKGAQSDNQKIWQEKVEKYANKYIICRTFDEFKFEIKSYIEKQNVT